MLEQVNQDEAWVKLAGDKDPWLRFGVLKYLADRAFGKPHQSQTIDVNGNLNVTADERRRRVGEVIAKLAGTGK